MTCEVWFYHLERTGLDQALPELLEKTLAKGWRALVRTPLAERVEHLDGWLWSYRDDSFLPHGVAGEPHEAEQPVLIAAGEAAPNNPDVLVLLDGAEPGPLDAYQRCLILFDGRDEAATAAARARWKSLKAQGLGVAYWKQGERGWEKAA